jgi:hypothetical protein
MTADLKDYVKIEFSGDDGEGSALVDFDMKDFASETLEGKYDKKAQKAMDKKMDKELESARDSNKISTALMYEYAPEGTALAEAKEYLDEDDAEEGMEIFKDLSKDVQVALLATNFFMMIEDELDEEEDLSNGDKVTWKLIYNEDMAKKAGIKLKNTEITFKVSGLDD